jgi:Fe-S cluster assembly protein SufD
MDSARADMLAARSHLETQGWVSRRSEPFRHLPPPALAQWLGQDGDGCDAPALAGSGWTLTPMGSTPASGFEARWLDALNPEQRAELFAGLPAPGGDDAPFAWAHRALCRQGLRLTVKAQPGKPGQDTVWLQLRHLPRAQAEAPLLVLDLQEGVRCVLLESHEHESAQCGKALAQNLQLHVRLAPGASLQHLRVVAPDAQDSLAHNVHATLAAGAEYSQALVATGAGYHLQRNTVDLMGPGAKAHHAALLLVGEKQLDQQVYTHMQTAHTTSDVHTLALAQGKAHVVANAHTRIAQGADEADVRQRLSGVPLAGNPRLVLRPHMEILHDNVQAAHGATWGALPEDALFYARQRGLDAVSARTLIIEGMARALLERCLPAAGESDLLGQWLASGWLTQAIERHLSPAAEVQHG